VWGFGIIKAPVLDFAIELLYGVFCWWYFKGSRALLIVIIVFNVLDLPVMLASGDSLRPLQQHPYLLPSFILFQILITWWFVWRKAMSVLRTSPFQGLLGGMPSRRGRPGMLMVVHFSHAA